MKTLKKHVLVIFYLISNIYFAQASVDQSSQPTPSSDQNIQTEEEFPKHSTNKYLYKIEVQIKPTEQNETSSNTIPQIISDTLYNHYFNNGKTRTLITKEIHNHKKTLTIETWTTRNPSYLTLQNGILAGGIFAVAFVTYLAIKYKNLNTLSFPIPTSVEDIEKDLQAIQFKGKLNIPLLFTYAKDTSQEKYNALLQYAKDGSQEKYYALLQKINEDQWVAKFLSDYNFATDEFGAAYHEAGHALMVALTSEALIPTRITIKPKNNYAGATILRMNLARLPELLTEKSIENQMMNLLSGGIAYQLLKGERLSAEKFLNAAYTNSIGMGALEEDKNKGIDTDLYFFKNAAQSYFEIKYQKHATPEDIKAIAIEMYENAYDILDAHKDRLDNLAQRIYKEKTLDRDDIYTTIDIERPKLLYEYILSEKTINLLKTLIENKPYFVDPLQTGDVDAENYSLSGF